MLATTFRHSFQSDALVVGFALTVLTLAGCAPEAGEDAAGASTEEAVVNVYSARHYDTDDALYENFKEQTGIQVNLIEGDSAALLERLGREGEDSPADIFITVDAGRLHQAETEGIFQPTSSPALEELIPASLRHPEGLWFGLTKRARVIFYAKDRVDPTEITRYEDLADPKWKGKVLIRSSSNVYNQSLMGSIVAAVGEEAAEEWCTGVVANFAREPQGGDRDQIRGIAAGEGDLAVGNTYYFAQMIDGEPADQEAAAGVGVIFPNQEDRGVHVNISGAGIVRDAPNAENAVKFLEYLASPEAQAMIAGGNKEYPVAGGADALAELAEYGSFVEDELNAAVFGAGNQNALMIMDRCGWR
ncbi:MAG: Fe(3+) ABC transporter substrate-binding protein [Acidobacteriota bacterium]